MSEEEKDLLTEKAFRRGFQHGWITGRDRENNWSEDDVAFWRFLYPLEKNTLSPIHLSPNVVRELTEEGFEDFSPE